MVEIGSIEARLTLNSSQFEAGINEAESSLKGFAGSAETAANGVTTSTSKIGSGAEDAGRKVAGASVSSQNSMKGLALGFSQTATSAFSLYQSFDNLERKQYAVEKANLMADRATQSLKKAQDDYNAAIDKYGADSTQAADALAKLNIATDAKSLADEKANLSQKSLNESMVSAGLMVIPSVVSGVDGIYKAWGSIKNLDMIGHFGGLKDAITGLGTDKIGAIGGAVAGAGALYTMFKMFNETDPERRKMWRDLSMVLGAASAAMWAMNLATAFGLSLMGVGAVMVVAATAAAAGIYLLSEQYKAPDQPPLGDNPADKVKTMPTAQDSYASSMQAQGYEQDIYGNWQPASYFLDNPGLKKYATGGWAMTPQLAMVAENEPELMIPESRWKEMGGGGGTHIDKLIFNVDGSKDVDLVAREILKRLRETAGVKY